jgi:hypothetical protein
MHQISEAQRQKLSAEISGLDGLDVPQLEAQWKALYGSAPPRRLGRDLLRRAVAYGIQERLCGGLSVATRRLLKRIAEDARAGRPITTLRQVRKVEAGSVLRRQWGGTQHQVSILAEGVLFRGERYRSLSAVARVNHR